MLKTILRTATVAAVMTASAISAFATPHYEWTTKYPFSGFHGGYGRGSYYCDYIKYPKRHCIYKRVCHHGACYEKPSCRVVGWKIRQSCS